MGRIITLSLAIFLTSAIMVATYLFRANAPVLTAQTAGHKVEPEGTQDESARKVLAAAAEEGGPDAATAGASAGYRQRYDAFRAMAAGALAHGDLTEAAQAASNAYPKVLDGM